MGTRRRLSSDPEALRVVASSALATQTRDVSPARPRPRPRVCGLDGRAGPTLFWPGVGGCTIAVAGFLVARLTAWPPHEDETLALFVGRESLPDLFETVQTRARRGAASLPRRLARRPSRRRPRRRFGCSPRSSRWRSVPGDRARSRARLAGRAAALVATALVSASWMLLFHGIYGRMYSLFLLTSTLSYLALPRLRSSDGGRRRWALWALAILATVATHPYGALVLASQVVYVARARANAGGDRGARRRGRSRHARSGTATSSSRADSTSASDPAAKKLVGPLAVLDYLVRVAGRLHGRIHARARRGARPRCGRRTAALGREPQRRASSTACVIGVPTRRFLLGRLRRVDLAGVAPPGLRAPVLRVPRRARAHPADRGTDSGRWSPRVVLARRREVAWGWDKTRAALRGRAGRASRRHARTASAWLAADGAPRRRPLRLRAALPRRLGARPLGLLGHCRAPRRREARARLATRGAVARSRHLGLRRERHEQLHAAADDPAALSESPRRSSRRVSSDRSWSFAAEPADADAEAVPRADSRRRSSSASRSTSATRT